MFKCELRIEGIDDEKINSTFSRVLDLFKKQGYSFENKIQIFNNGIIKIEGQGEDGRCAFCKYFRKTILEHYKENKIKGSIELIDCPFNPDKRIDYSPETVEARKELIDLFEKMKKNK